MPTEHMLVKYTRLRICKSRHIQALTVVKHFFFYFTMNSQHSKQIIFFRSLICRHMQHSSVHYTVCFGFNAVPKVNVQNLNLNLRTSASPEESGHEKVPLLSVSLHQVLYNLYLFLF